MNKKILLIDACARKNSRTRALAETAAGVLRGDVERINLYEENVRPLDENDIERRDGLIASGAFDDDMFRFARAFAEADEIVIAAPYWDLSFPSALKCFVENICVVGLTFRYSENGIPVGLCRAKRLVYVTTAGGFIPENDFGYGYIKSLCESLFGIKDTLCFKAEGLDIDGADVDAILRSAEKTIKEELRE